MVEIIKTAVSWVTIVRILQGVFSVIALGVSAGALNVWYKDYDGAPLDSFPAANILIAAAVLSALISAYHLVTTFFLTNPRFAPPVAALVLDAICWVLWLSGFAYMTVFVGVEGPFDPYHLTGLEKASVAFGVIEWLLFFVTLGWNIYLVRKPKVLGESPSNH